jgi:acid phosphatase type 7
VAAGAPDRGYYSFELGSWHVVALNSNIAMRAGSRQEQWLRADLAQHRAQCTLAYWHHPRFSSGITHGNDPETQALWDALYEAGATVVIAGHEHNYERFAPQTPTGARDTVRGIREFVAGTGGGGSYFFGPPKANSEVRSMAHGVLALTLSDRTYHWQFLSVAGEAFADSGTAACHRGA